MGSITSGIGLISGIDSASLIDSLITLESLGKFRLQEQLATINTQRSALLDINARLLNFRTASKSFRLNDIFASTLATSNNEDALTASAGTNAQEGAYKFIVRQLVSSSQEISHGFATRDSTPLSLDNLSFEIGRGNLSIDRSLEELNGGQGVDRGEILITDRDGNEATIDLTDVTSINEVLDRINDASDVSVTATVSGDGFVITDTSGGAGTLTVADVGTDTTATDLGIAGSAAAETLTGSSVHYLGGNTALSSLNDGNGVLVQSGVTDFEITTADGTQFDIDLGRVDLNIDADTLLSDLNDGDGIGLDGNLGTDDLKIVDRSGNEYLIQLSGATTVGDIQNRISTGTGGRVTLDIVDGEKFKIVDSNPAFDTTSNLQILGTDDVGDDVAEGLGILNEDGVAADEYEGDVIPSAIDKAKATTLQNVVDRINEALDTVGGDNAGRLVASIGANGLVITDNTVGAGSLVIESTMANPNGASDLGIETAGAAGVLNGSRILGGLDSVLTGNLNGGAGLQGGSDLTVTDRNGNAFTVTGLDGYDTLSDLIDAVNADLAAAPTAVEVRLELNDAGNGVKAVDFSGGAGTLDISSSDGAAAALGIEGSVSANTIGGSNLQHQYVSESTLLSDLNYGRGIGTGSFEITDSLGQTGTISIGGSEETVYDVIQEINSRGLAINARVNDNGDGIIIEDTADPLNAFTPLSIESLTGTAAADLNIVGSADAIGDAIDGSYEISIDVSANDSLDDIVAAINDAGAPINATVVNSGSGTSPFRLSISSGIAGQNGRLVIDSGDTDLGFSTLSEGNDAKVFFGGDTAADSLLITSTTNTLDNVVDGLTIDLLQVTEGAVTVNVNTDTSAITGAVSQFVTTFNDVLGRIDAYDFFDTETEQRGPLLGDSTTAQLRTSLYSAATGSALNVEGSFRYLSQIGIGFNSEGQMTFDEDEFLEAYENDPESVAALFDAQTLTEAQDNVISPGIISGQTSITASSLGFGPLFDRLLDDLTNSIDGTVKIADNTYQSRIDLINDRIENIDVRLESRRQILTNQFVAMEQALAQLQTQQSSLGQLSLLNFGA